jgi:hypothetical protein
MKWARDADGNYFSDDGQLWIHRLWSDEGHKTRHRTWWTLCSREADGWNVVDDVKGFASAKKLAEQLVAQTGE